MQLHQNGKNALIFVFVFLLLGLITGNILFYGVGAVITAAISYDLVNFMIQIKTIKISFKRTLNKTKLFSGIDISVEAKLELKQNKFKTIYFYDIYPSAFLLTGGKAETKITSGAASHILKYELKAVRRGKYEFTGANLDIQSEFGMIMHKMKIDSRTEAVIYPSVLSMKSTMMGHASSKYGSVSSNRRGAGIEVWDIRKYVPGDDLRYIDWKTSLRLNSLFIKEFQMDAGYSMFVLLDHSMADNFDSRLDHAVNIANYLMLSTAGDGMPAGLVAFTGDSITHRILSQKGKNMAEIIKERLLTLAPAGSGKCSVSKDRAELKKMERLLKSTEFYSILYPFLIENPEHLKIIEKQGIYQAIKNVMDFSKNQAIIAIITDLANEVPLIESVRIATYHGNRIIMIILSKILFRKFDIIELEEQYWEYLELHKKIEKFRRMPGVKVVEAGPCDMPDRLFGEVLSAWKMRY